eukprot:12937907-Alexandrium_andersonii.AAC.1
MEQVLDVGLEQAHRRAASLVAYVHAMLWVVRDAGRATAYEIVTDLAHAGNVVQGSWASTCHQQ